SAPIPRLLHPRIARTASPHSVVRAYRPETSGPAEAASVLVSAKNLQIESVLPSLAPKETFDQLPAHRRSRPLKCRWRDPSPPPRRPSPSSRQSLRTPTPSPTRPPSPRISA